MTKTYSEADMRHSHVTTPYRIGWWTHKWWPSKPLLIGLLTGNQPSPRADNGSRFVGRRKFIEPIWRRLTKLRRPHRPWQAEAPGEHGCRFARRALTAKGAERKMIRDLDHLWLMAEPSPWQRRKTNTRRARRARAAVFVPSGGDQ